jgi:hypothetical protein
VELVAVEEPEDPAHKEQDGLIERPGDRCKPEGATPANRSGDSPVSNDDLDGADRASDEEAHESHASSVALGTRPSWSFQRGSRLPCRARDPFGGSDADERDVTKRVCYDERGLPLYAPRGFTVRFPW